MEGQAAYAVSASNESGLIVITATLFMTWMILVSMIRLYLRLTMNGPLGLDDLAALSGGVLGIANVAAIMVSVSRGLGKLQTQPLPTASVVSVVSAEKALYAADLLFLAGHCAAKMSVSLLLTRLGRDKTYLFLCKALLVFTGIWGVTSVIAIGLQCQMARPWVLDDHCADLSLRWNLISAFDIVTEVLLVVLSVYLVWEVRMQRRRKIAVVLAFVPRLVMIVLVLIRQTFLSGAFGSNSLFRLSNAVAMTEVLLHCSIMAATIPCLKPFVGAFNTGWGQGIRGKGGVYYERTGDQASRSILRTHAMQSSEAIHGKRDAVVMANSQQPRHLAVGETQKWTTETEAIELEQGRR